MRVPHLLVVAPLLLTPLGFAGTVSTFTLNGTLAAPAVYDFNAPITGTVTGTVALDVTTGLFQAASLTVVVGGSSQLLSGTTTFSIQPTFQRIDGFTGNLYVEYQSGHHYFNLELLSASAAGYQGGVVTGAFGAVIMENLFTALPLSGTLTVGPPSAAAALAGKILGSTLYLNLSAPFISPEWGSWNSDSQPQLPDATTLPADTDTIVSCSCTSINNDSSYYDPTYYGGDDTSNYSYDGSSSESVDEPISGDPINIGSGNVYQQVTDYHTTGANRLQFTRYYNSLSAGSTYAASLGKNWRSTFDRYVRINSSNYVVLERADGKQLEFVLTNGKWVGDSDVDFVITNAGNTWHVTDNADTIETYASVGTGEAILTSITYRNGYTQTLLYNAGNQLTSVADSYGRSLSLTYENGLLQNVTTPDAVALAFNYEPVGEASVSYRLQSVSYSTTASQRRYSYEDPNHLYVITGITDESGKRFATWTYDSQGRGLSSQHADGANLTTIAYNDIDGSRTVSNALGQQTVYKVTVLQGVPKVTEMDRLPTATTSAASRKFTYDANGYVASATDWNGNLTTYANDSRGRPMLITRAAGSPQARTSSLTYHETFHLPVKLVQDGLTTTFAYDASGNLLTKTLTDTTNGTIPYSTSGTSRIWTYTWSKFLLASVVGPRVDVKHVTTYSYDSSGALTSVTNALGQVTKITAHLPGGLPETIVDPNGVVTQFTYDMRLRRLTRTVTTSAGPLTSRYAYDPPGNLLSATLPDGTAITHTYDTAHRLILTSDSAGNQITYTLNAGGRRTQTTIADVNGNPQRTHGRAFDALGRVISDTGGAGQMTSFAYDAHGNIVAATDPLKNVVQQGYDVLNRRIKLVDAAGGITQISYDSHDRPTTVVDANGGTTTYIYDGFGDLIQQISPDTGKTVYRYDLAGNLTQKTNADGTVVTYANDALNRVTAATYAADPAENVTYTYDEPSHGFGVGRLTTVSDAAGTLGRMYDERGNIVSDQRISAAATLITSYTYDAASRLASVTYPSGWSAAYTRDAAGRITAINALPPNGAPSQAVVSGIGYQPFGPINGMMFGNGIAETRGFDADYRLVSLTDAGTGAIQNFAYSYDQVSNVLSANDAITPSNSQTFGYDALNRLVSASGSYGQFGYRYDAVGNRLSQTLGSATTTYSYAKQSNRLASITANGMTQTIGLTGAGLVANADLGNGVLSVSYNQAGRLATVTAGTNPVAQYTYDAFGHRAMKVGAVSATTLFTYDGGGRLLEETDDQGNAIVDYVYLNGTPVATIQPGNAQIYFLHNDRLGTPQVATDASQTVQWIASYQPFGATSTGVGNIVQNLRLPGQEWDADTGFYHNGFRDYAPGWGKYLESDPIGLGGGVATYSYAGSNPIKRTDPSGLIIPIVVDVVGDIGACAINPVCRAGAAVLLQELFGNAILWSTAAIQSSSWFIAATDEGNMIAYDGAGFIYGGIQGVLPDGLLVPLPIPELFGTAGDAAGQLTMYEMQQFMDWATSYGTVAPANYSGISGGFCPLSQ